MPINANFVPQPSQNGGQSLQDAKEWLRVRLDDGVECPCCSQFAKIYRRKLNARMTNGLLKLYRAGGYGHLPTIAGDGCEVGKLRYWGLVDEDSERRDDGGRSGWWRITDLGYRFVRVQERVRKYALIYDGRCLGLEGEMITIRDSLGAKFNYDHLMAGL